MFYPPDSAGAEDCQIRQSLAIFCPSQSAHTRDTRATWDGDLPGPLESSLRGVRPCVGRMCWMVWKIWCASRSGQVNI
jgi:hypothetical protein